MGVDLGCGLGYVSRHVLKDTIKLLYQCEMSEKLLVGQLTIDSQVKKMIFCFDILPFTQN